MSESLGIVSYNLHGINNGRSLPVELCSDPLVSYIAIQEHYLTSNNLHLLNSIHPDFIGFGISAMSKRLEKEIYRGRPFGGVGSYGENALLIEYKYYVMIMPVGV
jgi:hypothetical protein